MVSCIFRVGSGVTKAKKQNNQKKRFMDGHLIFLLAILLRADKKEPLTHKYKPTVIFYILRYVIFVKSQTLERRLIFFSKIKHLSFHHI